jgi:hypothetical protein
MLEAPGHIKNSVNQEKKTAFLLCSLDCVLGKVVSLHTQSDTSYIHFIFVIMILLTYFKCPAQKEGRNCQVSPWEFNLYSNDTLFKL